MEGQGAQETCMETQREVLQQARPFTEVKWPCRQALGPAITRKSCHRVPLELEPLRVVGEEEEEDAGQARGEAEAVEVVVQDQEAGEGARRPWQDRQLARLPLLVPPDLLGQQMEQRRGAEENLVAEAEDLEVEGAHEEGEVVRPGELHQPGPAGQCRETYNLVMQQMLTWTISRPERVLLNQEGLKILLKLKHQSTMQKPKQRRRRVTTCSKKTNLHGRRTWTNTERRSWRK
jgi:hypothetical protein